MPLPEFIAQGLIHVKNEFLANQADTFIKADAISKEIEDLMRHEWGSVQTKYFEKNTPGSSFKFSMKGIMVPVKDILYHKQ